MQKRYGTIERYFSERFGIDDAGKMVLSFVASVFIDCRIYAFPNSGGWYDFGYPLDAGEARRARIWWH